ncbi:hypothetical protein D910_05627 [Dendroctonus ponderosae]
MFKVFLVACAVLACTFAAPGYLHSYPAPLIYHPPIKVIAPAPAIVPIYTKTILTHPYPLHPWWL